MLKSESNEHGQLKLKARDFLQSIGCQDIQEEYRLPKIQYSFGERPRHWRTKQCLVFDVAGFTNGRLIAIECGSIVPRKLSSIAKQGVLLYLLPFGRNKPFLWQRGIHVCPRCGNKI